MNIQDALKCATNVFLENPHILKPRLEAEILLGFVLGVEQVFLHAHSEYELKSQDTEAFFALIKRRAVNEPIEYLINNASFFSEKFYVNKSVLIPRPESEILVEKVCEIISKENLTSIAEIGVGCGALSISVARICSQVKIIATDISKQALNIASKNIECFGLDSRIALVQTSLLEGIKPDFMEEFELVFSNPPYISHNYKLPPNVEYEPRVALFGGERGSEVLESIIKICATRKVAFLACEMGYDQQKILDLALRQNGYEVEFYKDLAGLYRGFVARFKR